MNKSKEQAKEEILSLVKNYYETYMKENQDFREGDSITYAARVFNEKEILNLIDSSLEFWLTTGRYSKMFEERLCEFLHVKYCALVNSGSSANLLAFYALTSYELGERRINKGDEVITVAASFPTTISAIIQYGAIPVFLDVTIPQYNIDVTKLEDAISPRTKAVIIAHTLGNPFDLKTVKDFCKKYNLWLIEDNCDALGSKYKLQGKEKLTGTIGDIGTSSFYPPHHMTMGEGGAVYTNNPLLYDIMKSFRDWGRDCRCVSGMDNLCGHRYDGQYGDLPKGYDHKYVYSHFGFNLKVTDMQAAIGCAQLDKLPIFIKKRKENWNKIRYGLFDLENKIILPESQEDSEPSWFGFLITVRDSVGITREEIVRYLESKKIQTRMLFAGNIIKQPCFNEMRDRNEGYRIVGELKNTDIIMKNTFWIGVYPGMTDKKIDYMIKNLREILNK